MSDRKENAPSVQAGRGSSSAIDAEPIERRKLYHKSGPGSKGKWVSVDAEIRQYDMGVKVKRGGVHFVPASEGRATRGKICGFSDASRRRLREALVSSDLEGGSWRCGLTLTLPWAVKDWGARDVLDDFRAAVNHFGMMFKRRWPMCAIIYRVELQQRGAPHLHAVMYCPRDRTKWAHDGVDISLDNQVYGMLLFEISAMWSQSCKRRLWTRHAVEGGYDKRGVRVDPIKSDGAMIRYLLDHTSKHKQAQLGYKGRQWGYINRPSLVQDNGAIVRLNDRARVLYYRAVSRLMRYPLRNGRHMLAPFGWHYSKRRKVQGVRYGITAATTARLVDWANNEALDWVMPTDAL